MYSFEFKHKLRQLNPNLYVRDDVRSRISEEWSSAPLYIKRGKRDDHKSDYNYLDSAGAKFLRDQESGNVDEHVCGVPVGWIPEFDIYEPIKGRELARGWRTIVLLLVKKKLCTLEKAQRVFCASLGENRWDKMSYESRVAAAREEVNYAE